MVTNSTRTHVGWYISLTQKDHPVSLLQTTSSQYTCLPSRKSYSAVGSPLGLIHNPQAQVQHANTQTAIPYPQDPRTLHSLASRQSLASNGTLAAGSSSPHVLGGRCVCPRPENIHLVLGASTTRWVQEFKIPGLPEPPLPVPLPSSSPGRAVGGVGPA